MKIPRSRKIPVFSDSLVLSLLTACAEDYKKSEHFPSIFGKVREHFRQGLREFPKSIFGKVSSGPRARASSRSTGIVEGEGVHTGAENSASTAPLPPAQSHVNREIIHGHGKATFDIVIESRDAGTAVHAYRPLSLN